MKKYLILTSIILLQLSHSFCCSCNFPTEIPKAYQITSTIIYGEIVALKNIKLSETMDADSLATFMKYGLPQRDVDFLNSENIIEAKLLRKELFKGTIQDDTITLYTELGAGSCGFQRFRLGQEFIIYASPISRAYSVFYPPQENRKLEKTNTLWVSRCSITSEFDERHFTTLKYLKQQGELEIIARIAFSELKTKGLLINSPQIHTGIALLDNKGDYIRVEFEDKEIITNIDNTTISLFLTIRDLTDKTLNVWFLYSGNKDGEYTGTLNLKKHENKWVAVSINYEISKF